MLQGIKIAFLNAFLAFFATSFVHLIAGAFQFVRMILVSYELTNKS